VSVDVRTPAYQALADDLRAQITSGRLVPGDRLPTEPQLCRTSGVSRSTVREALRLLASQHLIVTTRGMAGGSFVAHPSPAHLSETLATGVRLLQAQSVVTANELLEVRALVEIPAAGLAARRRLPEHIDDLRQSLFDPETTPIEDMIAQHPRFHELVATASCNPLLDLISRPLLAVANASELLSECGRDMWIRIDADHREIFAAIVDGDPAAAEAAAARHSATLLAVGRDLHLIDDVVSAADGV